MPTPTAKKAAAPAVNLDLYLFKPNPKPALLLWLLVTTNPGFIAQLKKQKTQAEIAAKLKIDQSHIEKYLAAVKKNETCFQAIQGTFQELANDDPGYPQGPPCPSSMDEVTGL